jgi:preprotein translocase subunit SecB
MSQEENLRLVRIYLKDASFESPATPGSFKLTTEPTIDLNIRTAARQISAESYEVTLVGSVTARVEGETLFVCEVQQAGMFQIRGLEPAVLDKRLNVYCPKQLFPFLRETIASLTMRGGFPPLQIKMVDFDGLFAERSKTTAKA